MLQKIEKGFLKLVNEERQRQGAGALTTNAYLDSYAVMRSGEIVTLFSHTRPDGSSALDGIKYEDYPYSTVGENICMTTHLGDKSFSWNERFFTGSDEQLEELSLIIFTLFKNSPGHYANMINKDYTECGIGISTGLRSGTDIPYFYVAHIFGDQQ
jgi:uncharacterized protein YkwD